ncbi:MAG: hypothetical protein JWN17_1691 [Frankiales bacterium]|nr:hypothetical protein [Frankiales bacterium]
MKLAAMFFAEKATNAQTLSVTGALWDGLTATAFPANHTLVTVLLLRPLPGDVGRAFPVQLHVNADADNAMAGHSHIDINCNNYREQTAVVVEVPCVFPAAGSYTVRFDGDIGTDALTFQVVGPGGQSNVAAAVEGYALGLQNKR